MLKAKAGELVFLGLSTENLKRLQEGKPILVKKETLGIDVNIVILHGETEDHIAQQLMDKLGLTIGPNTVVTDNRRKKH